jgi:hypothetical protein
MRARDADEVPFQLEGARRRFERWRQTRRGRSRIPEILWALAVKAAGECGLFRTARALGLDYTSLKRQVAAAAGNGHLLAAGGNRNVEVVGGNEGLDIAAGSNHIEVAGGGDRHAKAAVAPKRPLFIELASLQSTTCGSVGSPECILELEDPRGAKMRVHLKGGEHPDLLALTRTFWGGRP